jgi:hypothetical protein
VEGVLELSVAGKRWSVDDELMIGLGAMVLA